MNASFSKKLFSEHTRVGMVLCALAFFLAMPSVLFAQTDGNDTSNIAPVNRFDRAVETREPRPSDNALIRDRATDIRKARETNAEAREEKRDRLEHKLEERKRDAEIRRAEVSDRAEQRRIALSEGAKQRIRAYIERVFKRFTSAINRLEKLSERILSRVEKLEDRGLDMAEVRELVRSADGDLMAAQDALELFTGALESSLDEDSHRPVWETVKQTIQTAKESIKSAHRKLKEAVKLMKEIVRAHTNT